MIFRTKDEKLIIIDRSTFNNDHDYYLYIKSQVCGYNNNDSKKICVVEKLKSIVKKK